MIDVNSFFQKGKNLQASDVVDAYTFLGYKYKLANYRMFDISAILQYRRGFDIPEYLFDILSSKRMLGIAQLLFGNAFYIIFRSLEDKKFFTFGLKRQVPYGVHSFIGFTFGIPILVVEGLKDRDAISQVYPYVIAAQSAGLSLMTREILKTLTNRLVLLYDNDETGMKSSLRESRYLSKDFSVVVAKHPNRIKDTGSIIDYEYKGDYEKSFYLRDYYYSELYSVLDEEFRKVLIQPKF